MVFVSQKPESLAKLKVMFNEEEKGITRKNREETLRKKVIFRQMFQLTQRDSEKRSEDQYLETSGDPSDSEKRSRPRSVLANLWYPCHSRLFATEHPKRFINTGLDQFVGPQPMVLASK